MTDINKYKIDANDRTLLEVMSNKKYTVDYYQREYSWQKEHIEQLINDLTTAFFNHYRAEHKPKDVANYNNYYLGSFVISANDGAKSIVDGQQRLTSLTLLLIYLLNLQKELGLKPNLDVLIYSEEYEELSFNINVPEREHCLKSLFETGAYQPTEEDGESVRNLWERYQDSVACFPEELLDADTSAFTCFTNWLTRHVVMIEIVANSEENAYTIFETMNDRGLNLSYSEMLKGFVLSNLDKRSTRERENLFWKEAIQDLHRHSKTEDMKFFQAWLRAQYAETIRQGKADSQNEDFEKIGTRFHNWVRDNLGKMDLKLRDSESFEVFLRDQFRFFLKAYQTILKAQKNLTTGLEYVFYIERWGIAPTLSFALLLAPLKHTDSTEVMHQKFNLVARYIETFTVRRWLNFHSVSASSIRYTMYTLVKEIRRKSVKDLTTILAGRLAILDKEEKDLLKGVKHFHLHGQNRKFVKYLLARITAFIEQAAGMQTDFAFYHEHHKNKKPFEVEHIWADKFERHKDEFDDKNEFLAYRNRLGDLVLLPNGTNQSLSAKPYEEKREHYLKENLLLKSLHPKTYENNPNFTKAIERLGFEFRAHDEFKKADISQRQKLMYQIIKYIWSSDMVVK